MALPPSGPITMGMINTELGRPATQVISLNETAVRTLAQVPAGMISLSNFYGKSNVTPAGFSLGALNTWPSYAAISNVYEFNLSTETGSFPSTTTPTGSLMTGFGNTDSKAIVIADSQTFPTPTTTTYAMSRWSFSSKTFTAIAPTPGTSPNLVRWGRAQSRMQTENDYFTISPFYPTTPPNANNARVGYTKYNLPTESFAAINTIIPPGQLSPIPTTQGAFGNARVSFNANKNYSRGWLFSSSAQTASMSYPTSTGFAYFAGPIQLDMGAHSPAPYTFRVNPVAAIQNAENGFTFGGYNPAPSGNTWTSFMSRFAFGPQTATKNFQSVGVNRGSFCGWQTPTNGFFYGGTGSPAPTSPFIFISEIWKYQFPTGSMGTISQSMGNRNTNPYEIQSGPVYG